MEFAFCDAKSQAGDFSAEARKNPDRQPEGGYSRGWEGSAGGRPGTVTPQSEKEERSCRIFVVRQETRILASRS
jgi:hypothetical protein